MADKPVTREEKYLAYLTGDYTGEIPKPITRKEKYLYELCLKGIGGEISPEEIKNAVNDYLEKNPVKPGATTEQAAPTRSDPGKAGKGPIQPCSRLFGACNRAMPRSPSRASRASVYWPCCKAWNGTTQSA